MFKGNDYALYAARIISIVFVCVGIIASLVVGILCAIEIHWAYFLLIFAGWLATCICWIFTRLLLAFFCDIKLIRNKLYGEENDKLEVFFKSRKDDGGKTSEERMSNENVESKQTLVEVRSDSEELGSNQSIESEQDVVEDNHTNKDKFSLISIILATIVCVVVIVTVILVKILAR